MSGSTIWPLVVKDLTLFFRDRFFAFITVLGLVFYAGLYLVMPDFVDEMIGLGLYAPTLHQEISQMVGEEAEPILLADSEDDLMQAVLDDEISVGIVLPADLFQQLAGGSRPEITIYLRSDAPEDMAEMAAVLVEAMLLTFSDSPTHFDITEQVLGSDMVGQQIPARDRLIPMILIMVLMFETFGVSSLIAQEIQTRTIHAILVTPMGVRELLISKGITGVMLTLPQTVILMLIMGGFQRYPLLILATLFSGTLLVTGIGFLMGAAGKDMLSIIGMGTFVIILLSIPPLGVVFPGIFTGWVRLIPSYYLADTLHQVANMGAGWQQVWPNLMLLLGSSLALLGIGALVLKRRFA